MEKSETRGVDSRCTNRRAVESYICPARNCRRREEAAECPGEGGTANVADALAYVREVRARFAHESWKYHEFLGAMKAFKRGTCVDLDDAMTTLARRARDARA